MTVNLDKKRGALSTEDMAFIQANCMSMPVSQMAVQLKRREEPILSFLKKKGLVSLAQTEDEQATALAKRQLNEEAWWPSVSTQCDTKEERSLFVDLYLSIIKQLNMDCTATEKLQIKDTAFCEIYANRVAMQRSEAVLKIEAMRAELSEIQNNDSPTDKEKERARQLSEMINYANNAMRVYADEAVSLMANKEKLLKSLKVSRDQRKKNVEESTTNFAGYVKSLMDEKKRADEGFDIETMKMAKDKAFQMLAQPHLYGNGVYDKPMLNCDTVDL